MSIYGSSWQPLHAAPRSVQILASLPFWAPYLRAETALLEFAGDYPFFWHGLTPLIPYVMTILFLLFVTLLIKFLVTGLMFYTLAQ